MNKYMLDWFQSKLDFIEEVELKTTESEQYLDTEKQLNKLKNELLAMIPDSHKGKAKAKLNEMEELSLLEYNILMRNTVCALEFEDDIEK